MDEREPCFCCGEKEKPGISVTGHFLCEDCERLLVEMQPGCEGYERLVERCKTLWAAPVH